jgi:hypothetical protein
MLFFWPWDRGFHGRVDQVREPVTIDGFRKALFVATDFYVLYGFPLIPLGTYALIADPGLVTELGLWIGIEQPVDKTRLRLSFKSVLFGYVRALLAFIFPLILLTGLILLLHGPRGLGAMTLAAGLGLALVLRLSYRITRANPERAVTLKALFEADAEATGQ